MNRLKVISGIAILLSCIVLLPSILLGVDMSEAQKLLDQGELQQAIFKMEDDLADNPDDFSLNTDLGSMYYIDGKYDQAQEKFTRAAQLAPSSPIPWNNLGLVEVQKGNIRNALENYKKALELEPGFVDAMLNMGTIFLESGHLKEALQMGEKASTSKEKKYKGYYLMAQVYKAQEETDKAILFYGKTIEEKPDFLNARMDLGFTLLYAKKDYDKAIDQFLAVLEIDKTIATAHFGLGVAFMEIGEDDGAINALKTALYYEPKLLDAYLRLGLIAARQERQNTALKYFKAALEVSPTYDPALYNIAYILESINETDKALDYYLKTIEANPAHYLALDKAGFLYAVKQDFKNAEKYYTQAINNSPTKRDSVILKLRLAKVLLNTDRQKAEVLLNEVASSSVDEEVAKAAADLLKQL